MGILKKVDYFVMKMEEYILSYSIILISIMIVGNVVNRALTGSSWPFAAEISKYAVYLATFMGIGYAARKNRHINMSAFFDMAPFPIRKALAIIIPTITSIILFIIAYYAYAYMMDVYDRGRVSTAMQVPVYLLISFVPLGLVLGAIQFLRNAWINIKEKDVWLATEMKDYE